MQQLFLADDCRLLAYLDGDFFVVPEFSLFSPTVTAYQLGPLAAMSSVVTFWVANGQ
jgi:hypothetical protein